MTEILPIFKTEEIKSNLVDVLYVIVFDYLDDYEKLFYNRLSFFNYRRAQYNSSIVFSKAISNDDVEIAKFLIDNFSYIKSNGIVLDDYLRDSIYKSHFKSARFLIDNGAYFSDDCDSIIAENNKLDVLKEFKTKGLVITTNVIYYGLVNSNRDMINFGMDNIDLSYPDIEIDIIESSVNTARNLVDLSLFKDLISRFNKYTHNALFSAVESNRLDIIIIVFNLVDVRTIDIYIDLAEYVILNCSGCVIEYLFPKYFPMTQQIMSYIDDRNKDDRESVWQYLSQLKCI